MTTKQLLASTSSPAFAVDERGRLTGLNRPAELVLGQAAEEVIGKRCHDVICAKDIFGNVFCREDCCILVMAREKEPISAFRFQVRTGEGEYVSSAATVVTLPEPEGKGFALIHVLRLRPQHNGLGNGDAGMASAKPTDAEDREAEPREVGTFGLTHRELQVLRMLTLGKNCQQIAETFSISVLTVRNHVHNMRDKLGVRSQTEAVAFALRNGLV